jgi:hypothetical protein
MLRKVAVTRYVTPLREGGSLPAIVEASDLGTYVLKFRGAGQGEKVLVAEIIGGGIARALGLRTPEIVLMTLDGAIGRNEPDYEIRQLIKNSIGVNLGFDYLPGSVAFDAAQGPIDARLAARIVWLDGLIANVDRTARNSNLLLWHRELYVIDHGAALYFHHDWPGGMARARAPFPRLADHVLAPFAADLASVDEELRACLGDDVLEAIVADVPDGFLPEPAEDSRRLYVSFLRERLAAPRTFVSEARRG